jgi:hypothetical protein
MGFKEWYHAKPENKVKHKLRMKKWRNENKDSVEFKGKQSKYAKKYYEGHRTKHGIVCMKWYMNNRHKVLNQLKVKRKQNKGGAK